MAEDTAGGTAATEAATEAAIAALEQQRALLGDAVTDVALAPLRERLATLRGAAQSVAQKRQVTVLFLDIVGSTSLGQQLEPEELHAALDGLLAEATTRVNQHRGRVLQYAGDNLLAVFGADAMAAEPEGSAAGRAVRCALALRDLGGQFGQQMLALHRHAGCSVRVGLHTGPVLLGAGVDEANSIRGFAVHMAARMEQSAPPGSIRISHDTWLLVRHGFSTEAQPPLLVKGAAEPLRTHLVLAERPSSSLDVPLHGLDGVQAPLIGREAQQHRLNTLLAETLVQRRRQAATLEGEPGVGKSRLLHEWRASLPAAGHRVLLARAQPALRQHTFGLLRALVLARLGIADSDDAATATARFMAGVAPALGTQPEAAAARAHPLAQLLGLPLADSPHVRGLEPQRLRRIGLAAFQQWLLALVPAGAALVLVLEDLHWADDDSLDALAALLAAPEPAPLLLVSSARPELRARRGAWPECTEGVSTHHWIVLLELDAADRQRLAQALLAPLHDGGDDLHALLVERSDGNPFFMEELLRMLLDHGVVVPDEQQPDTWRVQPQRLQQARLPTTLVEVLQARLDALQPAERRALQQASIVGPVFWHGTLEAIDAAAPQALPALRNRGLLDERTPSAFADTPETAFHHHVLQQVAYDSVLRAARRQGHAAVARWLAARAGDRAGEHLATTAQHFEHAGELGTASQWYSRAGTAAYERGAQRAALAHVQSALRCVAPDDAANRFDLHLRLAYVADALGQRELQQQALEEAARLAEQLDDPAQRAHVAFNRALLASRLGLEADALSHAEQAAGFAAGGVEPAIASQAQAQVAWSLMAQGRQAQALERADFAVAEGRQALLAAAEDRRAYVGGRLGMVLMVRANVLKACSRFGAARADAEEALPLAVRAGLRRLQASAFDLTAGLDLEAGRFEPALATHRRTLQLALEVGDTMFAIATGLQIAQILWQLGRADEATSAAAGLQDEARACNAGALLGRLQMLASSLALDAGRVGEAEAAAAAAEDTCQALGNPALVGAARAHRALVALARGDTAAATPFAELLWKALEDGVGFINTEAGPLPALACHRVFASTGDPRAGPALERAHAALMDLAAPLDNPAERDSLLHGPRWNREVMLAWAAHHHPQARQA
jgi:predicted ATPase/class 3 adenylate cyclase